MDITKTQQQAAQYMAQGQYSEAIALYEQCIDANPTQMPNYWHMGLACLLQGEESEAQAIWLSAIAGGTPEEVDMWMGELVGVLEAEAIQHLYSGKAQLAQRIYWQILEIDSDRAEAHYNLGTAIAYLGDVDEAIACWQKAIDLKPDFVEASQSQGSAFQRLEEFEKAIPCYFKALEIKPDCQTTYNLGLCFFQQGRLDEAIECFQNAIQIQPDYAPAYGDLGMALLQKGNLDEGIVCLKKAIQIKPKFAQAYCKWINTLAKQGKPNEVIKSNLGLFKALQSQQQLAELYLYLGNAVATSNYFVLAVTYYRKAISLKLDSAEIYLNFGKALAGQGNFDEAIAYYQKAIHFQPHSVEIYLNMGKALAETENFEGAITCYQRAIKLNPKSAEIYFNLGNALSVCGNFNGAIACFRKNLELQPGSADTYCNLGIALAQNDKTDEALACFQKVLEINSDFANIIYDFIITLCPQSKLDETSDDCQQILPVDPPNSFYETTQEWAITSNLDTSNYINIYPENIIHLKPPITPDTSIHFSFRFGSVKLPASFVAVVPDGRYWLNPRQSKSAVITSDNQLLGDVSPEFPLYSPGHPDKHPSKHSIFSLKKLPPIQSIDGTVAVLSGLFNDVYFHWIFDILPRLELLRRSGIDIAYIDKFLINNRFPFQRETLKALGIPETKILETSKYPHIKATKLVVPSFPGSVAWMPKWACDFLRTKFLNQKAIETSEKIERIYISREKARYRRLVNEDEVVSLLTQFGFKSVTLESMSVTEQAALMANAKVVVAPHGGGLTNIVFCSPNTKVIDIFSPYYVYPCYWLVSNLLGFEYYPLLGETFPGFSLHKLVYPNQWMEDIFVNLDDLLHIIKFAGAI